MLKMRWFFGDKECLADAYAVRRAVFIEEQGVSEADEYDGTDAASIHLVIYDKEDTPISTGRVMITDDFVIGRIATLKQYRGQGLGRGVMEALIDACVMMGGERQILSSQTHARTFYESLGFVAYGEEYEDAGIPHIAMERVGGSLCKCSSNKSTTPTIQTMEELQDTFKHFSVQGGFL